MYIGEFHNGFRMPVSPLYLHNRGASKCVPTTYVCVRSPMIFPEGKTEDQEEPPAHLHFETGLRRYTGMYAIHCCNGSVSRVWCPQQSNVRPNGRKLKVPLSNPPSTWCHSSPDYNIVPFLLSPARAVPQPLPLHTLTVTPAGQKEGPRMHLPASCVPQHTYLPTMKSFIVLGLAMVS